MSRIARVEKDELARETDRPCLARSAVALRGHGRRSGAPRHCDELLRRCPIASQLRRPNRLRLVVFPIRVVTEYQRMVVFRLGRMSGVRGPGLVWLLPFFDRVMTIDMRESFLEIPHQTVDHEGQRVDLDRLHHLLQGGRPGGSVVQVANFAESAHNIAATTLRSVVGDITLDDVLAQRDESTRSCATSSTR